MTTSLKSRIIQRKQKVFRAVFGTLSFSTALFIFQACYGTPADLRADYCVEGVVTSRTSGLPISGIKVSWLNQPYAGWTDPSGKFTFYLPRESEYTLRFEDTDAALNGKFLPKDTLISASGQSKVIDVRLDAQ